jgi:hypothetical protein
VTCARRVVSPERLASRAEPSRRGCRDVPVVRGEFRASLPCGRASWRRRASAGRRWIANALSSARCHGSRPRHFAMPPPGRQSTQAIFAGSCAEEPSAPGHHLLVAARRIADLGRGLCHSMLACSRHTSRIFVPIRRGYVDELPRPSGSITRSLRVMLSDSRTRGWPSWSSNTPGALDRLAELDASLRGRKEHFCIYDLWLKSDEVDAR